MQVLFFLFLKEMFSTVDVFLIQFTKRGPWYQLFLYTRIHDKFICSERVYL